MDDRQRAAVEYLARETLAYWQLQAKQRRITTPLPAAVAWHWAGPDVAAPAADLHLLLAEQGVVTRLRTDLYAAQYAPGRIVILGGPGAGKTSAMLLLLIDVLAARRPGDDEPIPVWLTLGGWSPDRTSLHDWASASLRRMYPGLDGIDGLLREHRVALFLDGLDEMPPAMRARALQRLDHEAGDLRLVLTSRPDEFRDALTAGRIWNTAVVELQAIDARQARPFLLAEQLGEQRTAWEAVAADLERNPDGVAARTLTSPLALSLARDGYTHADPRALLDEERFPTPDDLLRHLLSRFVDLAFQDVPERHRRRAVRWLAWLAACLAEERDLCRWKIPRWTLPASGPVSWTVGVLAGIHEGSVLSAADIDWTARRISPAGLRGRAFLVELRGAAAFVLLAVAIGGALVLVAGMQPAVAIGAVAAVAAYGVIAAATRAVVEPVAAHGAIGPHAAYRTDRRTSIILGAASGGVVWAAFCVVILLHEGPLTGAGIVGLALGAAVAALPFGLLLAGGATMWLGLAEGLCWLRGRPVRFMPLLEDALRRQVLRQAGPVYQFRHALLQDHLAERAMSLGRTRGRL